MSDAEPILDMSGVAYFIALLAGGNVFVGAMALGAPPTASFNFGVASFIALAFMEGDFRD